MERLRDTSLALYDLRTNEMRGTGLHMAHHVVAGGQGLHVGEIPFDPSRHPTTAINPLSAMEMVTGLPYVPQVVPFKSLAFNVVIHDDSGSRAEPIWMRGIPRYKQQLADSIHRAIIASKQVGDTANIYLVGNPRQPGMYGHNTQFVRHTEEPLAAAQKISELCGRSYLSFVLGDFTHLPLEDVQPQFRRTIAVKTNHPLELNIRKNVGVIPLGGDQEIDTSKTRKVNKKNEELENLHAQISRRITKSGMLLAATVDFENNQGIENGTAVYFSGQDSVAALDTPLARAVTRIRKS